MRTYVINPLVVAILLASAAQATAGLIRFDNANPGQPEYFDWRGSWLDITSSADLQTGIDNGVSSFEQTLGFNEGVVQGNSGSAELEVDDFFLAPVPDNDLVPSGSEFGFFGFSLFGADSLLEEGETEVLGVRIMLSDWHYGWIGVRREGNELTALAWAYESEPNIPVVPWQFPEPSTVLMILFGSMLVAFRKPRFGRINDATPEAIG